MKQIVFKNLFIIGTLFFGIQGISAQKWLDKFKDIFTSI